MRYPLLQVGVEIEVARVRPRGGASPRHVFSLSGLEEWQGKYDGSIPSSGVEAVLRRPLLLPEAVQAVKRLYATLPHLCDTVSWTARSGATVGQHVHIGMRYRPYTAHEVWRVVRAWKMCEPSFLRLVRPWERRLRDYCRPRFSSFAGVSPDNGYRRSGVLVVGGSFIPYSVRAGSRYCALNVEPALSYLDGGGGKSTVEFRLFNTPSYMEQAVGNVLLSYRFVERALRIPPPGVLSVPALLTWLKLGREERRYVLHRRLSGLRLESREVKLLRLRRKKRLRVRRGKKKGL